MNVVCIDFETTGVDVHNDDITEIGLVMVNPLTKTISRSYGNLIKTDIALTEKINQLTGIDNKLLKTYGISKPQLLRDIRNFCQDDHGNIIVDYFCGHRARKFDIYFFARLLTGLPIKYGDIPWLCTLEDIDYPEHVSRHLNLEWLAFKHGFPIHNAHRAVFDSVACANLICEYDINEIIKNANEEKVTLIGHVKKPWEDFSEPKEKEIAQALGFKFDGERKVWEREVRKSQMESVMNECVFSVEVRML